MTRYEWIEKADKTMQNYFGVSIFDYLSLDYMDLLKDEGADPENVPFEVARMNNLKGL